MYISPETGTDEVFLFSRRQEPIMGSSVPDCHRAPYEQRQLSCSISHSLGTLSITGRSLHLPR